MHLRLEQDKSKKEGIYSLVKSVNKMIKFGKSMKGIQVSKTSQTFK